MAEALVLLVVQDERPWVRSAASRAIRRVDPDAAAQLANGLSRDELSEVRIEAARMAWDRDDEISVDVTRRLLDDDDPGLMDLYVLKSRQVGRLGKADTLRYNYDTGLLEVVDMVLESFDGGQGDADF